MMMTVANRIDVRKLSLSAQKALHQRVIEAYKKGIRKLFKNPRCQAGWNKNVLFGFS